MSGPQAIVRRRDLVLAVGRDTLTFLQGQLSQDVVSMLPGTSRWTLHLTPQGRVIALARVTRLLDAAGTEPAAVIDTDAGVGEDVRANLARFKIRTACELTLITDVRSTVDPTGASNLSPAVTADDVSSGVVLTLPGFSNSPWNETLETGERSVVDANDAMDAALGAWRVAAGVPAAGAEIAEQWLPSETGMVGEAVAFGKGCYVGQELVERIDSRGRVNRMLCALMIASADDPTDGVEVGASIVRSDSGVAVGTVTTVAGSSALGYVRRDALDAAAPLVIGSTSVTAAVLR
jgi:tRNA-modifying protein YgfZ